MTDQHRLLPQRLETDKESVERDLLALVLTVIELIPHQLITHRATWNGREAAVWRTL